MNREIKFRANRFGELFEVLEWDFTGPPQRQDILLGRNGEEILRECIKNLDIMQYTGFKDNHGKDIYEGDIIKGINNSHQAFQADIYWASEGYYLKDNRGDILYLGDCYNKEVIGNIYENPELLNEKN